MRTPKFATENGHKRQVTLQRRGETNIKDRYFQKVTTLKSGLTNQVTAQKSNHK